MTGRPEVNPLDYVADRVRHSLEIHREPIGLTQIVGTHGTQVDSVFRLARDGKFSGGMAKELGGTFHITPNLQLRDWQKTEFAGDVSKIVDEIGLKNPIEISMGYAEVDRPEQPLETAQGVIIGFGRKVLDLVQIVDMDIEREEPEVVLSQAPPLESVRCIYPVDEAAAVALHQVLDDLR
jgi:hypothetical protein